MKILDAFKKLVNFQEQKPTVEEAFRRAATLVEQLDELAFYLSTVQDRDPRAKAEVEKYAIRAAYNLSSFRDELQIEYRRAKGIEAPPNTLLTAEQIYAMDKEYDKLIKEMEDKVNGTT